MNSPIAADNLTLQRSLVENNPLFHVLEEMHDGVLICDSQKNILWFNASLKQHLALSKRVIGMACDTVIDNPLLMAQADQVLSSQTSETFEISLVCQNRLMIFQVHLAPLRVRAEAGSSPGNGEKLSGFVALFHDLTAAKKIERMRRDFVANVSHELRTPLTAINGFAETLLDGALEDTDNARSFIDIIYRHSLRLSQLVADLLDLSKLESPDFDPELLPLDLRPMIQSVLTMMDKRVQEKELTVTVDVPDDAPLVMANAGNIEQVFTNLLDNAVKYTPAGGSVSLRLRHGEHSPYRGKVLIAIHNTGTGIEAKHIPRLFERFYRVDKARSRDLGGTGLGLSIVKHIIQYHGGDIWVESELNQGTTFFFTLNPTAV
ncbi:MAG: ATP-binding protein [Candidatus Melainabacteria bacterium]